MNNSSYYSTSTGISSTISMAKVFGWMFIAILLTAGTAIGLPYLLIALNAAQYYGIITFIAAIAVFILSFVGTTVIARTNSKPLAIGMFALFAVGMGTWISPLIISYSLATIGYSLLVTSGVFGVMALYGFITKRELNGFGSFLFMVLIGALFISLLNVFFASTTLDWILSYVILGVYIGFIAYDVQRVKRLAQAGQLNINSSLLMALNLYIDFIYVFIRIVQLIGRNRD